MGGSLGYMSVTLTSTPESVSPCKSVFAGSLPLSPQNEEQEQEQKQRGHSRFPLQVRPVCADHTLTLATQQEEERSSS